MEERREKMREGDGREEGEDGERVEGEEKEKMRGGEGKGRVKDEERVGDVRGGDEGRVREEIEKKPARY